ncbi:importin subunit beta-3 [Marasmius tenuissimus]|nr:importin subunit beta-3 [Marasmius tenuissimus]
MDKQMVNIRTMAIGRSVGLSTFETMVIRASTLGARYTPYLAQSLEVTLPSIKFYFHGGVTEASAMYVTSDAPRFRPPIQNSYEPDGHQRSTNSSPSSEKNIKPPSSLPSLGPSPTAVKFTVALRSLSQSSERALSKRQPRSIADKCHGWGEDLALPEEIEDFALEDMGTCLGMLDEGNDLLVPVGSAKDLSIHKWECSEDKS